MADFTIADVLAWARTKPAGEAYNYVDSGNCALCCFLRETGRALNPLVNPYVGGEPDPYAGWGERWVQHPYPPEMEVALSDRLGRSDWSFGALVARLEKLCPETAITPSDWSRLDAYLTDIGDVARERVTA